MAWRGLDYPRLLLVALVLVTGIGLVVAGSTSTEAFGAYNPSWEGTSALQEQADAAGADTQVVRDTARLEELTANGTLVVVLSPAQPYDSAEIRQMSLFVERGGTLLIADDSARSNALVERLGATARLNGTLLRDEHHRYRSSALPVATAVADHQYTANVSELTLNYGTTVESVDGNGNATVLAASSEYGYLDSNGNGELDADEEIGQYPVAVAESRGDGQLILVSDPSIFINVMLDRTDNEQFARSLIGAHDRVVFDVSHAAAVPPLVAALLVVRDSAGIQLGVGMLALAVVALWLRQPNVNVFDRLPGRERASADPPSLSADELASSLARQHPEWEPERIDRIARRARARSGEERE